MLLIIPPLAIGTSLSKAYALDIKLSKHTPPEVILRGSDGIVYTRIIKTSGHVAKFDNLVHRAEYDSEKPVQLRKLCKAFESMCVYNNNLEARNNEVLEAQQHNQTNPSDPKSNQVKVSS